MHYCDEKITTVCSISADSMSNDRNFHLREAVQR